MKIRDSLTLDASGLALTRDGYLVGEARVSRAGNVQHYMGSEIGLKGEDASKTFGVYRDPDVVFDEDSMLSLAGRPVTRGHPKDEVTSANWKTLAVGQVGGKIRRDGEHVVAPMAIMDQAAAKEVADGARSLSAGYSVEIVADTGTTPDGVAYQYRQAGPLRFNHVAYLPDNNPRAGNTRIGDDDGDGGKDRWGIAPITDATPEKETPMTLKTVTVDGIPIEATDQGATVIATLLKRVADGETKFTATEKAHQAAVAAKDAELAKAHAERDEAKGKVVDAAALDKLVTARADLIGKAKAVAKDVKTDGLTDAAIRRAAVVAKLGEDAVKDKAEAYVDARFDILVEDATKNTADPFRQVVQSGIKPTGDAAAQHDSWVKGVTDLNAWRKEA